MNERETAETMGLQAFTWVMGQPDLFGLFLNATGASQGDLTVLLREPAFLGAVFDFLLEDDARVMGFCDAENLPYPSVMSARMRLPGGDLPHWT